MNEHYSPPSNGHEDERADRVARSMSLARLAWLQWIFAVLLSVVSGSIQALQFCFGLYQFGGLEYAGRVVMLSGLRVMGPSQSASAALFALVVWTHGMRANALKAQLSRAAPQTLLLMVLGAFATTALTIASGFLLLFAVFDEPWTTIWAGRSAVCTGDIPAGIVSLLKSGALVGVFCWFVLPAMARRSWQLALKIAGIFGFAVLVRVVFAFV